MAKTYTVTLEINTWKEHTCIYCAMVYAYRFVRTIKAPGPSAEKAQHNAQMAAAGALARSVNLEPCPSCGLYQPDMVAQQRAGRHRVVFWLAFVAFVIATIMHASYGSQADTAVWTAAIACCAVTVAHWFIELVDLNADPDRNRQLAQEHIDMGSVRQQPGDQTGRQPNMRPEPRSLASRLCVSVLCVAVVLAIAPEALRQIKGWPLNRECHPPVVGPGDQTRIYMEQSITSVKGFWRADPKVTVREHGMSKRVLPVAVTTNQNVWGDTIRAKSSEKDSFRTPWVQITLPSDPELAGKTLTCEISLAISLPQITGPSMFRVASTTMQHDLDLRLANAVGAGSAYAAWWWEGTGIGMLLTLICGRVLIRNCEALRKQAQPTRILQPADGATVPPGPGAAVV